MATPKSELLPVLPMDDVVVLPHMSVTLAVEGDDQKAAIEAARQGNRLILLVPRIDGKFGTIGTAARLGESAELPTGAEAFMIRGEYRARLGSGQADIGGRSEEHTSELQSQSNLVCRLLLEKNKEQMAQGSPALTGLAQDWRKLLFPQADDAQLADVYTQAVTVGLPVAPARDYPMARMNDND